MKKSTNQKLFSDLKFSAIGGIIYLFLSIYLTNKLSLSVGESFFLTVLMGAIFMILNAMKISNFFVVKK